ncbi:MAG: hypothetical protein ABUS54_00840, partial [Actinomycetota bacterium]
MRATALVCACTLALVAAGAAAGGNRSPDVAKTAGSATIHYSLAVRLVKHAQPYVLHISGAVSRDRVAVHLQLADLTLRDGTTVPGTTGVIIFSKPFLYERAPNGLAVNGLTWLR